MRTFRRPMGGLGILCLILLVGVGAGPVAGGSTYTMSVSGSTDIPDRTVTVEGADYLVSHVGQVQPGESIQVTVDAPADRTYDVYLYNEQIQIEQTESLTGDGTATFATGNLTPSTYIAAVYDDGEIQTLTPVVVAGYDVSADAPSSVEQGDSVRVTVSVTQTARTRAPNYVQVVVGDNDATVRVNATKSDGQYVATVPTDSFAAGDYALFAVTRGENETKYGRDVVLGMSSRHTLTIEETTPTPTPTPTDDTSSDGGTTSSTGSTSASADSTPTATSTPTPTASPTQTQTPTASATPSPTVSPTASPTVSPSLTPTPESDGQNVITPGDDSKQSPTKTGGQPGFGLLGAGLALLGSGLLARRT